MRVSRIGQKIRHYHIEEKLGSGAFGVVFKALDLKLERYVALKFLNKKFVDDSQARLRFINEARTVSALDHPNIATVHEINETADGLFISMSYYAGETLDRYLETHGPLSLREVCRLATQIARGLTQAHARGVTHRDLKPSNVMVTKDGAVKILDFGMACMPGRMESVESPSSGGTAAYMAPEEIQGFDADHRVDLFALGVILYEMSTGRRPFQGEHVASLYYAIVNEEPEPLTQLRPDLPQEFETIVTQALEKDPDQRFQTADKLADRLARCSSGITARFRRIGQVARTRALAALGVAVLVLLLILATLFRIGPLSKAPKTVSSLAVVPVLLEGVEPEWTWLGDAVLDLLNTELGQYPEISVVEERDVPRPAQASRVGMDLQRAFVLARAARAEAMLWAKLEKSGTRLIMTARVFDARSGSHLATLEPIEGEVQHLYTLIDELCARILPLLDSDKERAAPGDGRTFAATGTSLDAYRYFLEGKSAALGGRYRTAVPKLRQAIRLDSTFIRAYYYLAWQYATLYEYDKARKILEKGKPHVSALSQEERLRYLAVEASIDRRWRDYAVYHEKLITLKPQDASLHFNYAFVQFVYFRRVDFAIPLFRKTIDLDSTHTGAFRFLAYAYLAKGQRQRALQTITRFSESRPMSLPAHAAMTEIQSYLGEYEVARANCEKTLLMQPNSREALIQLTRIYRAQGKYALAEETAKRYLAAVSIPSLKADGHVESARTCLLGQRLAEARNHLDLALSLDAQYSDALWLQGLLALEMNDVTRAKMWATRLEALLKQVEGLEDRWLLSHLRAQIALQEQRPDAAVQHLQNALKLFPLDRAYYLNALAEAQLAAGRTSQAIESFGKALTLNPRAARAAYGLGLALEQARRPTQARQAFQRFLTIWSEADPNLALLTQGKKKVQQFAISTKR